MVEDNQIIVPFLKWAGGKRWLVSSSPKIFPQKFNRYIEPFLGSGAVFFHLRPKVAILADKNEELIETYQAIKSDWQRVLSHLRRHQLNHSKKYFYDIRERRPKTSCGRAARFIYLNRTCWNGLFRVNLQGQFNVPIGTKTNVLLDSDDFASISKLLTHVLLKCSDFEEIINLATEDDFVFVDPPYTVKHNHNGFIKYNEKIFSWEDQERLSAALHRAENRGAKFLMTNADHRSVRSLYRDYSVSSLSRASILAANPSFRSITSELVVSNYRNVFNTPKLR